MSILGISTIKEYFDLEIPKGILLYPHCGKDTYDPIALFIDSIKAFHFTDINRVGLPVLQCDILKDKVKIKEKIIRGDNQSTGFIPVEVVSKAVEERVKYKIYDISQGLKKCLNIDVGKFLIKDNIKRQIWTLGLEQDSEVEIFTHSIDTIGALLCYDNIAVYYHRCKNEKRPRKNVEELKSDLINIMLDRIVDGGILLSDSEEFIDRRLQHIGDYRMREELLHIFKLNK